MDTLPPTTMELNPPAIRQQAFVVPQKGVYNKDFTMDTVDQFDYVPNTGLKIPEGKTKFKVKDALDNEILDDKRLKNIGNMTVEIVDELNNKGEFNAKTNTIKIKRADDMEETLYHEIQHAIDKKTATNRVKGVRAFDEDNKKPHDQRKVEQVTRTNDILMKAEKQKDPMAYIDGLIKRAEKVKTEEAKAYLNRLKMAKELLTN